MADAGGAAGAGGTPDETNFRPFDSWLKERMYNIGDLPMMRSYKPSILEKGRMLKLPPPVTLKRQPYRHVDLIEFMNVDEVASFVRYWQGDLQLCQQRIGFLYGYYRSDSSYPLGVRAVLECMYEPKQTPVGTDAFQLLEDPFQPVVDKVVEALGLERIGVIFTHLGREELLTSQELMQYARIGWDLRKETHFTKYPLSKQVIVTLSPDAQGAIQPHAFMVADMLLAFVRDEILMEPDKPNEMKVKEVEKHQLMPQVLEKGKETKTFDPDWMIVRIADSQPKGTPKKFFQFSKFPRMNRLVDPTPQDCANYFRSLPSGGPSWKRFSDFHLLLFIAKLFDLETAINVAKSVAEKKDIEMEEVLKSIAG
uniref:Nuclear pore localisation protein NPL4 C-terminal domain-containing protein n=1 Tax=Chromera velia CCMP2878 TaxID=1169474 RepID=A0A0G4IAJ9_9ALVE|mmetsp:Transcript_5916/g.11743  ORF Transcript_5916/g.11743 Transcript_5916/m.11743 type:complete len:367 (+) Transcript_5916:219-1319(+)|eukprot:Cvel_2136.t1-p1 / transcript=Cvel_2136.t1 / gene=Cvel_2136 / organism=Chromera_velia_CCMP2878 / gene_product=Nuclear protein localization protein 4 homolog, putative / transcript_product=Nuclear protein localization protein 4 homolog, putative / location=Cvel_scaffold82:139898-144676(+) / protein_length=366 / sequence_SO=supercontig / SO=protein_coding / is_pseudo=false